MALTERRKRKLLDEACSILRPVKKRAVDSKSKFDVETQNRLERWRAQCHNPGNPVASEPPSNTSLDVGFLGFEECLFKFPKVLKGVEGINSDLLLARCLNVLQSIRNGEFPNLIFRDNICERAGVPLDDRLLKLITSYLDIIYYWDSSSESMSSSLTMAAAFRKKICCHLASHILMSNVLVTANDKAISANECNIADDDAEDLYNRGGSADDEVDFRQCRDVGFVRPRILVVCMTRQHACSWALSLSSCVSNRVIGKPRLFEEYGVANNGESNDDGNYASDPNVTASGSTKSEDYDDLFSGNSSELFRMGIRVCTSSVKLFCKIDNCDIIISSPLGLVSYSNKIGNWDYLSSIEIVVFDRFDALEMVNPEHLCSIFSHLNQKPTSHISTDINRIRNRFLQQTSHMYRQTIVISGYKSLLLDSCFHKYMVNIRGGAVRLGHSYSPQVWLASQDYASNHLLVLIQPPKDDSVTHEDYFMSFFLDHFIRKFYLRINSDKVIIVVPSYVETTLLKARLQSLSDYISNVCYCHESKPLKKIISYRKKFMKGIYKVMVVSERMLFYRRWYFRGASHAVFFGPPKLSWTHGNVLKNLQPPSLGGYNCSLTYFLPSIHSLEFERIVGSNKLLEVLKYSKSMRQSNHSLLNLKFN